MGIRFRCPNGHRLHVKTFLAGRRGICPHCGTKCTIPVQSEVDQKRVKPLPAVQPTASSPRSLQPQIDPGPTAERNRGLDATGQLIETEVNDLSQQGARGVIDGVDADEKRRSGNSEMARLGALHVTSNENITPAAQRSAADPLAEAPQAMWYVRPPSGGQFGPATVDVMRRWIVEGRITEDSLVWREGWTKWQTAQIVLSLPSVEAETASDVASPQARSQPSIVVDDESLSVRKPSHARIRSKSMTMTFTVVIVLGLISVVLLVGLIQIIL